jgi:hypothetical protein
MTPNELKALREKHRPCDLCEPDDDCLGCAECDIDDYPCDVIKALDEVDRVLNAAEVYGLVVRAMTEQNSHETITELTTSDQNRNLNSPIPATDPYDPQERTTYLHPSERRAMREAHQPHVTFESQCNECSNSWPCDSNLLLDQLDAIAQGLSEWLYNIKLDPKVTIDLIIRILDGGL